MLAFCKVFDFTCAVRGFHVYPRFWTLENGQLLNYFHQSGNASDPFTEKVCERNFVKHLPRGISGVTKFIIKPGSTLGVELTSDHYRWSPLVQAGLEIKWKVTVKVPNAIPRKVTECYCALVEEL